MPHTSKHHIQNVISQRQVKIKRCSKRYFSRQNKGFRHAIPQNTGWGVFSPLGGGGKRKKNFLKNFEIFLSPTTFRPEMLER